MEMSLRGISSLPAAQYSGVGDSVESGYLFFKRNG